MIRLKKDGAGRGASQVLGASPFHYQAICSKATDEVATAEWEVEKTPPLDWESSRDKMWYPNSSRNRLKKD